MPDLAAFQRRFAASLLRPADAGEPAAIAVYRNTALFGTLAALRANYPTVARLLGDSFDRTALDYAAVFRPATPVLAGYGARFADWLAENGWKSALPFLPDVARIDRMRTEAHLAADALPFAPTTKGDWQSLRPGLHPATRFTLFETPALRIWSENADGQVSPRAGSSDGVLVTRPHGAVIVHAIGPAHVRFLREIASGATVAGAAASAAGRLPGPDLARLFASIITSGALAATEGTAP